MEVKKVDHIGIAVKSLDEALPFYTDTLGLSCVGMETVESEQVRVAFLKVGDVKLELLEPLSEHSPIASFIEKRGEGIHHVALGVDDIELRIQELKNNGIRMIHEQPKRGAGGARIQEGVFSLDGYGHIFYKYNRRKPMQGVARL